MTNEEHQKMNPETLEALEGSIKKWTAIVRSTKAEDRGVRNCPLCQLFFSDYCMGCPVEKKTGVSGCKGSPYIDWIEHMQRIHVLSDYSCHKDCPDCLRLAKAELKFLRGLLPEKKKEVEK